METTGMICNDRYERISSSGIVFNGKPAAKGNSKNAQVNGILIRLIEEEIELSIRSQNCLNNAGIRLIGQLVRKSASELLDLKNFGRKSLREIEKTLTEMGLTLEMALDFPPWNGEANGAAALGIDLKKVKRELLGENPANHLKKLPFLQTKYLLDRLESKFEKDMPYLADLIKPHRKWLAKEMR